ncbi:polymer-forming cytoskeletal protein [Emcibacter nanhaiensis]|uniref:Polymer-forming cytoskeletal protein n=2 Tax=Emcibacter nanhaiensis TaxID=1505037 RepID=A0A501PSD4_9PROT|nr:polymer-forming cytoskeletal protein [Emcibacter nanhaiensis]
MFSKSSGRNIPEAKEVKTMKPSNNAAPSIIGSDVTISGDITTLGEIQLDGTVEGDVRSESLTVGEHGSVNGTVVANNVIVKGSISGQIKGRNIRLEKSAKVKGDIMHETLSVEAGAFVEGSLTHRDNPMQESAPKAIKSVEIKSEGQKTA